MDIRLGDGGDHLHPYCDVPGYTAGPSEQADLPLRRERGVEDDDGFAIGSTLGGNETRQSDTIELGSNALASPSPRGLRRGERQDGLRHRADDMAHQRQQGCPDRRRVRPPAQGARRHRGGGLRGRHLRRRHRRAPCRHRVARPLRRGHRFAAQAGLRGPYRADRTQPVGQCARLPAGRPVRSRRHADRPQAERQRRPRRAAREPVPRADGAGGAGAEGERADRAARGACSTG